MGDLNRGAGSTFASGDTITAAKLHGLVDNATLKDGAVTSAKIADGAVTAAKIASGASFPAASIPVPQNNAIVGNASNVGAAMPLGASLSTAGNSLGVADAGVTTAKIADGAVTAAKIAALSPSPAGTYGSATLIPVLVVNAQGQVTGVTTAAPSVSGTVSKTEAYQAALPSAGGVWSIDRGGAGFAGIVQGWLVCTSADAGYAVNDRVEILCVASATNLDDQAFTVAQDATEILVMRDPGATAPAVLHKSTRVGTAIDPSKWGVRIVFWL